jgi:hypothetical protein
VTPIVCKIPSALAHNFTYPEAFPLHFRVTALQHCSQLSSFNQQVGAGLQLQVAGKLDKISVLCKN